MKHGTEPRQRPRFLGTGKFPLHFRVTRWVTALLLLGASVLMFIYGTAFRTFEAGTVALWLSPLLPGGVHPLDTHFVATIPGPGLVAFNVTIECTAMLLVAPLALTCALALAFTRIPYWRALLAMALALAVTFTMNQLRLGLIAWTSQEWGMGTGFDIGHRYIGSLIALSAFGAGFLIFLWITFRTRTGPGQNRNQPTPA